MNNGTKAISWKYSSLLAFKVSLLVLENEYGPVSLSMIVNGVMIMFFSFIFTLQSQQSPLPVLSSTRQGDPSRLILPSRFPPSRFPPWGSGCESVPVFRMMSSAEPRVKSTHNSLPSSKFISFAASLYVDIIFNTCRMSELAPWMS